MAADITESSSASVVQKLQSYVRTPKGTILAAEIVSLQWKQSDSWAHKAGCAAFLQITCGWCNQLIFNGLLGVNVGTDFQAEGEADHIDVNDGS